MVVLCGTVGSSETLVGDAGAATAIFTLFSDGAAAFGWGGSAVAMLKWVSSDVSLRGEDIDRWDLSEVTACDEDDCVPTIE